MTPPARPNRTHADQHRQPAQAAAPSAAPAEALAYVESVYLLAFRALGDHHRAGEATKAVFRETPPGAAAAQTTAGLLQALHAKVAPTVDTQPWQALPHPKPASPLWQAVAQLTPLHCRVLTLRYGQGLTNQQLARILNRSETATLGLTQRALAALAPAAGDQTAVVAPADTPAPIGQMALPGLSASLDHLAKSLSANAPDAPIDPLVRSTILGAWTASRTSAGRTSPLTGLLPLTYSRIETPVGALLVAYRGETVCVADLTVPDDLFERECTSRLGERPVHQAEPPSSLGRHLRQCIDHGDPYDGELDLTSVPAFQRTVLLETLKIRAGEVRSYGWLAKAVGSPGAARAVGTSMAHNPIPFLIPCHRVVRSDYHIGEYGCGGPAKKRELLAHEGVDVPRLERLARLGVRYVANAATGVFCAPGCYTARDAQPQDERTFISVDAAASAGFSPCRQCHPS